MRHSRLYVVLVLLSCASALLPALEEVKPVAPPKSWDKFVILVWQYKTNARKDKASYESVNLRGIHIDRKNADLQALSNETGWPYYVDHAADKGYLHLGKAGDQVKNQTEIIVRPNSLSNPATISKMKDFLKTNIGAAKGGHAVAYAFDDEISLGSFCTPVETDGSPANVALYRKALEKQYGSIEKLNAQYGSSYSDFNAIAPKSYEHFRSALTPTAMGKANLSQWCDWRTYMDDTWSECLADLTRYTNGIDASVPAGYVGGHMPSAWGGNDYRKLSKSIQWIEAYDIGATTEILRSFWGQDHGRMQTFFPSQNVKQDAWFFWYYLSHGVRGVICWPALKVKVKDQDGKEKDKEIGWFDEGKAHEAIVALAPTFKEVQGPLSQKIIDGTFQHDPVAIYYSHPSIQVTWAFDAACHGKTWPRRSSSMDNAISTANVTRIAWLKTLEDVGIQAKFIHQDHLLGGVLEKENYKVLLLNKTLCLSDAEAAAIKSFAAKGGVVIADHLCGVFDEHGKARAAGALDELFGVKHDLSKGILSGDTLTEIDGENGGAFAEKNWKVTGVPMFKGLPIYERGLTAAGGKADYTDGGTAVVRNGKHVYLNISTAGVQLKRPKNEIGEWLAFTAELFKQAGVTPRVKLALNGEPAKHTEALFWKNGDSTTLCVVKNLGRKATIDSFGSMDEGLGAGGVKLKLSFAAPVKELKNERTGKDLGAGTDFEDDFTPWEANVYTYR
jgi:hypothetical protein